MAVPRLDDSQLLVLSTFAYRLDCLSSTRAGRQLDEFARDMENSLLSRQIERGDGPDDPVSQLMDYRAWFTVLASIRATPALSQLMVDAVEIDARGAKMMLLSDDAGNAYAVFAGTGPGEWEDNALAAYERDSAQQLAALAWFQREVVPRQYAHVVACGHSKGGNKAFYLAVRTGDALDRAVGFDAQGFSREFVEAYGPSILESAPKITAYSLDNDYVNGLLNGIAPTSQCLFIDGSHVDNPVAYHSPYSLFVPYHGASGTILEIGGEVPQGAFGRAFREFSLYAQEHASEDDYRQICHAICAALENIIVPNATDEERASRAERIGAGEGFGLAAAYLARFFGDTIQNVSIGEVLSFLLPSGKYGATAIDDLAIGALKTVSDILRRLTR